MKRRDWFKLIGAASSTTVVAGCKKVGTDKLIPYLIPPEEGIIPGEAHYVDTTCTECPAGCGISARVVDGFPVKLEGRKGHPINDGRLCMRGQASLTRLYHPHRLKNPLRKVNGKWEDVSWGEAYAAVREGIDRSRKLGKTNVYLSGRTSGALSEVIDLFCRERHVERWPEFEPVSHATLRKATEIAFGHALVPDYRIDKADFLLTLGADILETFVSPVRLAGRLAAARERDGFLWTHVEPHVSLTGLQADGRLVVKPGSEVALVAYLLRQVGAGEPSADHLRVTFADQLEHVTAQVAAKATGLPVQGIEAVDEQFRSAASPLVILGGVSAAQPAGLLTAVLTCVLYSCRDMVGNTVDLASVENDGRVGSAADLARLAERLEAGQVGTVLVSQVDPVSANGAFRASLGKAQLRVGLAELMTPTMDACDVLLPLSHSLESWGDLEPSRGLRAVLRPTLKSLHDTRTEGDLLLHLTEEGGTDQLNQTDEFEGFLRAQWAATYAEGGAKQLDDAGYRVPKWVRTYAENGAPQLRNEGSIEPTIPLPESLLTWDHLSKVAQFLTTHEVEPDAGAQGAVLVVVPSVRWFDGRSRLLQLLEEVPDPLTTVTYGDWVLIGEGTANKLGVEDGDRVRVSKGSWSAELPAKKHPLLQDDVYVVHMGMLDDIPARVDEETGEADWVLPGIQVAKTGNHTNLPIMAFSTSQEGRGVIPDPVHVHEHDHGHGGKPEGEEPGESELFAKPGAFRDKSMYPAHEHKAYQWAMVVDLDKCTGCGACAAACHLENNIPVVGLEDHLKGREMSWIRVEPRYEEKDGIAVVSFAPMMCQHCHDAPCEAVCPVYATIHNEEGLNAQIYNRCVGTRYCANNCPYKVRRFNWFDHPREEPLDKMVNPDMLVRSRGVMEKCTFCVQRIRAARDHAKDEGRKIRDGEVIPACAQTCPSGAIAFGSLKDPNSEVGRLRKSDRAFRVFEHLNTDPSVYYLKKKVRSV